MEEYIEKVGNKFHARTGAMKYDNVNTFPSRINIKGWGGEKVIIKVNNYTIDWRTNFKYGERYSYGVAEISFREIYIRQHSCESTIDFVNILNLYVQLNSDYKDEIIFELANIIAHVLRKTEGGGQVINLPMNLEPKVELEKIQNHYAHHLRRVVIKKTN